MNLLLLNQDWFAKDFRAAGHTVLTCGHADHLDFKLDTPLLHINTLIPKFPDGFKPDAIIALDNSAPISVTGLEETSIPTVFYSVDTHHHAELHRLLYHVFDYTFVAQKDYIASFEAEGLTPEWLPLFASRYVEASEQRKHKAVFVGNLNPKLNPERVTFFEALTKEAPVLCTMGEYWNIFPYSEIVINQTVKGDLNFRVFETMMCGSLLLTEKAGNGLCDLFESGRHIVCYEKNNVAQAASLIQQYLGDLNLCHKIAAAGRAEVLAKHTETHRAQRILEVVSKLEKKPSKRKFFGAMANFCVLSRKYEEIDTGFAARALLVSLRAAEHGLNQKEDLNHDLACFLVLAALRYDQLVKSQSGELLLNWASETYPEVTLLQVARLRMLLNSGKRAEAESIAKKISDQDTYVTFCRAEEMIGSLLRGS